MQLNTQLMNLFTLTISVWSATFCENISKLIWKRWRTEGVYKIFFLISRLVNIQLEGLTISILQCLVFDKAIQETSSISLHPSLDFSNLIRHCHGDDDNNYMLYLPGGNFNFGAFLPHAYNIFSPSPWHTPDPMSPQFLQTTNSLTHIKQSITNWNLWTFLVHLAMCR